MMERPARLLTLILASALALCLGACSSKKDENKSDEDIWAEATGEEAEAEAPAEEPEEEEAAEPAADEAAPAEGEAEGAADGEEESSAAPAPTEIRADGSRLYGAPLGDDAPRVALADVLAHADRYDGQMVRTEGEVARVCQAMGCWMELREAADGEAIRVPMAGHAFFLPKNAAGQRAEVAGRVKVAVLDAAQQEHLRSEGAAAAAQPVSLDATGVVLR